jgi:hypothetical protein
MVQVVGDAHLNRSPLPNTGDFLDLYMQAILGMENIQLFLDWYLILRQSSLMSVLSYL